MTDQIPPMPKASQFFHPTAGMTDYRGFAEALETWGRDLAARLAALQAQLQADEKALRKLADHFNVAFAPGLEGAGEMVESAISASQALAGDLAEALKGTVKELEEVIKSAESEAVHFDGDEFHERLTAGIAALARYKDATR